MGRSLFVYFFLSVAWHLFISKKACKTRSCGPLGLRCDINFKSLLWLCNKSALIIHTFSGAHFIYWVVNEDFLTFQFYRLEIQSNCPWYSYAFEKLAYLFSRRLGIIVIPRWYGVHRTFLKLLSWNWWSSILETVVSGSL